MPNVITLSHSLYRRDMDRLKFMPCEWHNCIRTILLSSRNTAGSCSGDPQHTSKIQGGATPMTKKWLTRLCDGSSVETHHRCCDYCALSPTTACWIHCKSKQGFLKSVLLLVWDPLRRKATLWAVTASCFLQFESFKRPRWAVRSDKAQYIKEIAKSEQYNQMFLPCDNFDVSTDFIVNATSHYQKLSTIDRPYGWW